jgi:hypothetical protein
MALSSYPISLLHSLQLDIYVLHDRTDIANEWTLDTEHNK